MDAFILWLIKSFIERQILKFGESLDWVKLRNDAIVRVQQVLPSTVFSGTEAYLVGTFIDIISQYFRDNAVKASASNIGDAISFAQTKVS